MVERFKHTELGLIPSEWEIQRMSSICDVRDGTHESPRYFNSGVMFITSKNIVCGKINFTDVNYISLEDAKNIDKRSRVDKGDILMSMIGTIGNCVLVDFEPRFCIKNVALFKPQKVSGEFLVQLLFSVFYQQYVKNNLDGGIQQFISLGALRNLDVPIPPTKAEQTAIAEALNDADALITELEKLIAKKKAIKQGTTYNLVSGKMRIKYFNKQWKETALSSYLKMPVTYGVVKAGVFQNTGTPMLRGGDIKDGRINTSDVPLIADVKNKEYSRTILETDDIVLALVGYPGEVARAPEYLAGANISRAVGLIRTNGKLNNEFLVHYFNSTIGRKLILAPSAGSAQVVVNLKDINKLRFVIPGIEEQTQIAQILSDMDAEIEALEQKLDKYKMLKQGMMQNLLTGKIRLI